MLLIPVFWISDVLHRSCSSFVARTVFLIRFVVGLTLQIQIHAVMGRSVVLIGSLLFSVV